MLDQNIYCAPVIVALPAQIDLTSQERAYDRLYAALASGEAVVIADFTGTTFCDGSSLRRLVAIQRRAAARDAQLRLVIPPDGPVHRVAELMDLNKLLPVYPSLHAAVVDMPLPRLNLPAPADCTAGKPAARADIMDLAGASHLHILGWQAWLGELRRCPGDAASGPALATVWDTLASLIDLHMRAEDEVCAPAFYDTTPQGQALAGHARAAHADIDEIIQETSLQHPGSALWWQLAMATLAAWARHCDDDEHGLLGDCLRRADFALRQQAGRQWRAFREACIRDQQYPHAPPQMPTCQLRRAHPGTPRLADPVFTPLACTCQACTAMLDRTFASGPDSIGRRDPDRAWSPVPCEMSPIAATSSTAHALELDNRS